MRMSISSASIPLMANACKMRHTRGNANGIFTPILASRLAVNVQCRYTKDRISPPSKSAMKFPSLSWSIRLLYSKRFVSVNTAISMAKPPIHHRLPRDSPCSPLTDQAESIALPWPPEEVSTDKSERVNTPKSRAESNSHTVCIRCIIPLMLWPIEVISCGFLKYGDVVHRFRTP